MRFLSNLDGAEIVSRQNAIVGNTGAIANTETQVVAWTVPANYFTAGDIVRVTAYYTRAGTNASQGTARIRIGTTTLTGAITASLAFPNAATAVVGMLEALVTVRTIGATGTAGGGFQNLHSATSPLLSVTAPVTINTTVSNIVELTVISGQTNNNYTFSHAVIEHLSAD